MAHKRVVLNALSTQPGGGLTVVRGLALGIADARPDWSVVVLARARKTLVALESVGEAVEVLSWSRRGGRGSAFLWEHALMGRWLVGKRVDAMLTLNYLVERVDIPQVVYHVNLLRFKQPSAIPAPIVRPPVEWLRDYTSRRALGRAAANVFESRYLYDAARAVQPVIRHPSVVYIGLPEESVAAAESGSASDDTDLDIGRVPGRIVAVTSPAPHKDNETLVRTLAELVDKSPGTDWHLHIAGGSHERWSAARVLVDDLGLSTRVTWHGHLQPDELRTLQRTSMALVSTSLVESFCMVAVEAMAQGCPAVVAEATSMPESVGDAAVLARPQDPASFAAGVVRVCGDLDYRRELQVRGFRRAARQSWGDSSRAFASILESV